MTWRELLQQKSTVKKKKPDGSLFRRHRLASFTGRECEKAPEGFERDMV
jgi:hypothetical protein